METQVEPGVQNVICAPVAIATLNRYLHLKACIDSLAANKLAPYTEIFISLDFPPTPKYESGYRQVKAYLEAGIQGFKQVHVFYQNENLGPGGNGRFLMRKIEERFDKYISTEDDNIFSQNFLEYMNWALKRYEDNEDIIGVTGYSQDVCWHHTGSSVQILNNEYNAWGSGIWIHKRNKLISIFEAGYMDSAVRKKSFFIKLLTKRPDLIPEWLRLIRGKETVTRRNGKIILCDVTLTMYMLLENKYSIMPTVTKVNNKGWDGSGLNCSEFDYDQPEMDSSRDWLPLEKDIIFDASSNARILKKYFCKIKIKRLKNRICKK
ncbi:glycosyltransferase [Acetatifactor muris]|uniref:Glycosyltransferase 2-like domain-containing protein n=1 Tax=Acetatifactor muris TaxID=879566 RepID=A0A2K4ZCG6_9FIRM|nr:hypothetical protein [Acetatifactor muris]MCR2046565.1 glycosyltransferase [Acetatifactor muris]SOY28155.1 hypothetical protein AMURIS_00862 [Acetatifactor muris]